MRQRFADRLAVHTSRLPRFVTSILVAVAILATPIPFAASQSRNLPRQPAKQLPSKHLTKTRTIWTSAARSSSPTRSESRLCTAKHRSLLSVRTFRVLEGMTGGGLLLVFRPLRC